MWVSVPIAGVEFLVRAMSGCSLYVGMFSEIGWSVKAALSRWFLLYGAISGWIKHLGVLDKLC